MSIYTLDKLQDRVNQMDDGQAKGVIKKILSKRHSQSEFDSIASAIMGLDEYGRPSYVCNITDNKTISHSLMEKLYQSPLMDFTEAMISAALQPDGPFQTREIMMIAALSVPKAYYMTTKGIPKTEKVMAGYILQMAGFEFLSIYDKDRKMPVKVWKSKYGWGQLDASTRAKEVMLHMENELKKIETQKLEEMAPLQLDDLI
jgi:hypothetical protein